ncbi:MAG: DUF4157 domain-containing protein [Candidatus Solibacter sp.]
MRSTRQRRIAPPQRTVTPAVQPLQAPPGVDRVLAGQGSPLDPALRHDMQHRFGHDFSQVRVHTGEDAGQSANDLNANAYTAGRHIVFGPGRFAPETQAGRRLLAHELTHVVQQSGTLANPTHGTLQRDTPSAKPAPAWTADDLKKMLASCDGGLNIWDKAKKANKNKDPTVVPGAGGQVDTTTGTITLTSTQSKCDAVQQLVQELSNLSRAADVATQSAEAVAGDRSRADFIRGIELLEYESGVKNVLTAFDACKEKWPCATSPKEWARKAKDFDDYFKNSLSPEHKEGYGGWWDTNCKAAWDKKHAAPGAGPKAPTK